MMLGGNWAKHNARLFYDSETMQNTLSLSCDNIIFLAILNAANCNKIMLTQMEESGYQERVLNQAIFWNLVRM